MSLWRRLALLALGLVVLLAPPAGAAETLRVGVMQSGTVHWELAAMAALGTAAREGVQVEVVPYASKEATRIALAGGAVDLIVDDWLWVSRSRDEGRGYAFVTHSLASGALYVRPDSGIATLADLAGRRLGVAGGALDKNWLLLRAAARRSLGADLATLAEPAYAAPPLLNALLLRGELPAVLNYWHYGVRLEAAGMRRLTDVRAALATLGAPPELPLIGWVFDAARAEARREVFTAFLRAVRATKTALRDDDAAWEALRPLMGAADAAEFRALRDGYREAIPAHVGPADGERAAALFGVLAGEGGEALVGHATRLADGTFWAGYRD